MPPIDPQAYAQYIAQQAAMGTGTGGAFVGASKDPWKGVGYAEDLAADFGRTGGFYPHEILPIPEPPEMPTDLPYVSDVAVALSASPFWGDVQEYTQREGIGVDEAVSRVRKDLETALASGDPDLVGAAEATIATLPEQYGNNYVPSDDPLENVDWRSVQDTGGELAVDLAREQREASAYDAQVAEVEAYDTPADPGLDSLRERTPGLTGPDGAPIDYLDESQYVPAYVNQRLMAEGLHPSQAAPTPEARTGVPYAEYQELLNNTSDGLSRADVQDRFYVTHPRDREAKPLGSRTRTPGTQVQSGGVAGPDTGGLEPGMNLATDLYEMGLEGTGVPASQPDVSVDVGKPITQVLLPDRMERDNTDPRAVPTRRFRPSLLPRYYEGVASGAHRTAMARPLGMTPREREMRDRAAFAYTMLTGEAAPLYQSGATSREENRQILREGTRAKARSARDRKKEEYQKRKRNR